MYSPNYYYIPPSYKFWNVFISYSNITSYSPQISSSISLIFVQLISHCFQSEYYWDDIVSRVQASHKTDSGSVDVTCAHTQSDMPMHPDIQYTHLHSLSQIQIATYNYRSWYLYYLMTRLSFLRKSMGVETAYFRNVVMKDEVMMLCPCVCMSFLIIYGPLMIFNLTWCEHCAVGCYPTFVLCNGLYYW
jgi:hypothetical protein